MVKIEVCLPSNSQVNAMASKSRLPEKCFICGQNTTFYLRNIYKLKSKHTETPISEIIENIYEKFCIEFIVDDSKKDRTIACQDCLIKFDEYDMAIATAALLEKELMTLLNVPKPHNDEPEPIIVTVNPKKRASANKSEPEEARVVDIKKIVSKKFKIAEPVVMKCNLCDKTFKNLTEMKSHTHPKTRAGRKTRMLLKKTERLRAQEISPPQSDDQNEESDTAGEDSFANDDNANNHDTIDDNYVELNDMSIDSIVPKNHADTVALESKKISKMSTVKRKSKYPNRCDKCGKTFLARTEFRIHMKVHEEAEKLVCDICGMTYKSKSALDIHVGMHSGLSPFECTVCEKHFTQKGALVRHMPIHTGERPYQCDKCGKRFVHYSSFHMHQLAHDNVRDKKCTVCGLELRSNSHLTRHMRVHSGEKPYSCPTCGQKFAQRYNMMTHYKAHQGIQRNYTKNHSCQICNARFQRKLKLEEHYSNVHNTVVLPNSTFRIGSTSKEANLKTEIERIDEELVNDEIDDDEDDDGGDGGDGDGGDGDGDVEADVDGEDDDNNGELENYEDSHGGNYVILDDEIIKAENINQSD